MSVNNNSLLNGRGLSTLVSLIKQFINDNLKLKQDKIDTTNKNNKIVVTSNEGNVVVSDYDALDLDKLKNVPTDLNSQLTQINTDLSNKQDKLTAGKNIQISNDNVISATDTTYNVVSSSENGLMTPSMLTKLNSIEEGATKYSLPTATSSVLGGVKVGDTLNIKDGVLNTNTYSTNTTTVDVLYLSSGRKLIIAPNESSAKTIAKKGDLLIIASK